MTALFVRESAAEIELSTVCCLYTQGTEHVCVFAFTRQMRNHARLRILVRLELEEIVTATGAIERIASVQHQAFSAVRDDVFKLLHQLRGARHVPLRNCAQPRGCGGLDHRLQCRQALSEWTRIARQIEHHVVDTAPRCLIGNGIAHGGHDGFEFAAADPQFAIERRCRPVRDEPVWRCDVRAGTRHQPTSIPAGADPVVFFAHPVVAQIDVGPIDIGEHQRRHFGPNGIAADQAEQPREPDRRSSGV
jgi:hypothetical protein